MPDKVADFLRVVPTSDRVRAAAWDAVYQSTDDADLQKRLGALQLDDRVKARIWDLAHEAPEETPKAAEDTSSFLSGLGNTLNPLPLIGAMFNPQLRNEMATNMALGSVDQAMKAKQAFNEGRTSEMIGHGLGVVPLIGTPAAQAGEAIASGKVREGLGQATGLVGMAAAPMVARGVRSQMKPANLEAGAASRVTDVMSPKVGPNKTRFGNQAEKVAPQLAQDLAKEGAPLSRQSFHADIAAKADDAAAGLDAAADARLGARSFQTQPLIDALLEKRSALTAKADQANAIQYRPISVEGKPATTFIEDLGPIGEDVVPGPNQARVAVIDQAISELKRLGPTTTYEPIRRIRQAYDAPAKAIYSPSMTADYMKAQGGKLGAADVTGVLRDNLAQWDPQTAEANAQYSLYKSAKDVLDATAEVERTRPRVGRQMFARFAGTTIGATQGPATAAVGYVAAPIIDQALTSGVTTQLKTAALMQNLATAIRQGNVAEVNRLGQMLKQVGAMTATSANESRSRTTALPGLAPAPAQ